MIKGENTREESVVIFGEEFVAVLEQGECEPTGRCQCDGDTDVEFASTRSAEIDGEKRSLTVYYYQSIETCNDERLFNCAEWVVAGYEID